MGSVTVTLLSHVFPVFDTVMRYANVSPASVAAGSKPPAAVMSVTSFKMWIPGCRGRVAVHEAFAGTSRGEGAGEDDSTEAVSNISPASMSA